MVSSFGFLSPASWRDAVDCSGERQEGCAVYFGTTVRAVTPTSGFISLAKWLRGFNVSGRRKR